MSDPNQRAPIAQAPLSVILQAHALSTETTDGLKSWRRFCETLHRPYEMILLQETRADVVQPATHPHGEIPPSVRPIYYDRAQGHRDAFNEAIRSAQYPLLVFSTCDDQFQPADLQAMFKVIDQVDLVTGFRVGMLVPSWRLLFDTVLWVLSRVLIGLARNPTVCWLGSEGRGRRWIARWVFGVRVNDPECPFRLARREIFARMPIQSKGAFVMIEMLAKANHLGFLIAEEPLPWTPPALLLADETAFSDDAWGVFRNPEFALPIPCAPPLPSEPPAGTTETGRPA